jgi:hypothetical protein
MEIDHLKDLGVDEDNTKIYLLRSGIGRHVLNCSDPE